METDHQIYIGDAAEMDALDNGAIDLVVTSPPYPMIQMWDEIFSQFDPRVDKALKTHATDKAFECMHQILDRVWHTIARVVKPGGIVCINIGDATRSVNGRFRLYANHARIISAFTALGFDQLPTVLWRKPTNAPNKFMGSGMLPPNAYVTLEHEYILIFRNGPIRAFDAAEDKRNRRSSAYFWEERNQWFSDVWFGLVGTNQSTKGNGNRDRSGAYPFELPYRLVNMFSVIGDIVLDPFLGTGTTMLAAMSLGRNCIGYEIDSTFLPVIMQRMNSLPSIAKEMIERRIAAHKTFVADRIKQKGTGAVKNYNHVYDMPVTTRQEAELCLPQVKSIRFYGDDRFKVEMAEQAERNMRTIDEGANTEKPPAKATSKGRQLNLF